MINVEQGALGAFKQQIGPLTVRVIQFARNVCHHGLEQFSMGHGFLVNHIKLNLAVLHVGLESIAPHKFLRTQIGGEHMVVQVQQLFEFVGKALWVFQVLNAQCASGNLVFVGWTNAASCRTDFLGTALLTCRFTSHIKCSVKWQDQRASFADAKA